MFIESLDVFAVHLVDEVGAAVVNRLGSDAAGAQVSEKHCGFVINAGGATAKDVRALMDHVISTVQEKYGVTLEPEVKFLGDF